MNKIYTALVITILVGVIFYLSWLPDPNIGNLPFFPESIGQWTNSNPNFRTAIPFFILGGSLELFLLKCFGRNVRFLIIFSGSMLVVLIAEVGQLLLPNRHFDLMDIFWGGFGALTGFFLGWIVNQFRTAT